MKIDNKSISIVIHGGCFEKNSAEVANILINYRNIFKESEIIFSISSSDFIDFEYSNEKSIYSHKKNMVSFCHIVNKHADKIAYSYMAQPLPPVVRDAPNCHANHMIESARNGLALASKEFVLRTRNDLLFKNRSFIEKYIKLSEEYYRTGEYTAFSSPVMISSLFTLNPFCGIRLPFHYSDWFNFGRLVDIRPIWDAPLVTLDFMTYYNSNYYVPGSREKERNFNSRLAIEQYVYFTFFSKKFKNLRLDYHNDDHSIVESLQVLLDNFIISDIYHLDVYYPKYSNGFNPYRDNNKRIMQRAWEYLSTHRNIKPDEFLYFSSDTAHIYTPVIFPLKIGAEQLYTKTGFHFGKSIVIPYEAAPGVACFGPHIALKQGSYTACVSISTLYPKEDNCKVKISATGEAGKITLGSTEYIFYKNKKNNKELIYLNLDFDNNSEIINEFEIVVETFSHVDMAIDYVRISKLIEKKQNSFPLR
ncbi:WavE lipopolysaccharide synthesis family protein [Komagataeibacter europaeus]|uniref:WavE lipopolysaccharide synthesis family protein n=1 Tax=Komagataeibacter europaeus TaxID=33995 RepID=UPI0015FB5478|nr:WavE lipopolysaccharide synthesis family protein [Komagataeibacter europaeus]